MDYQKITTGTTLEIIFPSDLSVLEDVVTDSVEFVTTLVAVDDLFGLKLVLYEGLTNGVKHGNKFDENKKVTLSMRVDGERLDISITDEGEGFEWTEAIQKDDQDVMIPSGRGLILFKEYGYNPSYSNGGRTLSLQATFNAR